MKSRVLVCTLAWALPAFSAVVGDESDHHHHGHHHKHHGHHHKHLLPEDQQKGDAKKQVAHELPGSKIVDKMKALEVKLAAKAAAQANAITKGHLLVNGPLPADFSERFAQAVGHATGVETSKVKVSDTAPLEGNSGIFEIAFDAPSKVVKAVENDAANPESKLAKGNMRPFLVANSNSDEPMQDAAASQPSGMLSFAVGKPDDKEAKKEEKKEEKKEKKEEKKEEKEEKEEKKEERRRVAPRAQEAATPVEEKGIDIDTAMPYGDLEPFGREDTAQELTESSVKESDEMVDQLERAEVAEEKRSVFRALTRLRGAAITSFDGVARSQTGNIDEYNKVNKWRKTHPLHHLADEESDVTKWAFPDNADF